MHALFLRCQDAASMVGHSDVPCVRQCQDGRAMYPYQMMDITYQKRYDTTLVFCLAEDTHTGNLFQPLHGILGQFVFIGGNLVHPNQRNVVQSFGKSGSTDIIRRTGFKLEGQFIEGSLSKIHAESSLHRPDREVSYPATPLYHKAPLPP